MPITAKTTFFSEDGNNFGDWRAAEAWNDLNCLGDSITEALKPAADQRGLLTVEEAVVSIFDNIDCLMNIIEHSSYIQDKILEKRYNANTIVRAINQVANSHEHMKLKVAV